MRQTRNLVNLGFEQNFLTINKEIYNLVNVAWDGNCLVSAILLAEGKIDVKFYFDEEKIYHF